MVTNCHKVRFIHQDKDILVKYHKNNHTQNSWANCHPRFNQDKCLPRFILDNCHLRCTLDKHRPKLSLDRLHPKFLLRFSLDRLHLSMYKYQYIPSKDKM
jgi:hypothetical protein